MSNSARALGSLVGEQAQGYLWFLWVTTADLEVLCTVSLSPALKVLLAPPDATKVLRRAVSMPHSCVHAKPGQGP
jgi:hypothetical protein